MDRSGGRGGWCGLVDGIGGRGGHYRAWRPDCTGEHIWTGKAACEVGCPGRRGCGARTGDWGFLLDL